MWWKVVLYTIKYGNLKKLVKLNLFPTDLKCSYQEIGSLKCTTP